MKRPWPSIFTALLIAFAVAVTPACGWLKSDAAPTDKPVIVKFEASCSSVTVAQQQTCTLSWKVLPGSNVLVSIEPEPGTGLQAEGSRTVTPRVIGANIYTIKASRENGDDPVVGTVTIFGK